MSYLNFLNAIKKVSSGDKLSSEEEDIMIQLTDQMRDFNTVKSQVSVVRNQMFGTATKKWVETGSKTLTADNTYSGSNTFNGLTRIVGSLQVVGDVDITGYARTSLLASSMTQVTGAGTLELDNNNITVPFYTDDGVTVNRLYKVSDTPASNITLYLADDLQEGDFRSFIFIIPDPQYSNASIIDEIRNSNDDTVSFLNLVQNNIISRTNGDYARQEISFWNIGGTIQASGVVQYFAQPEP